MAKAPQDIARRHLFGGAVDDLEAAAEHLRGLRDSTWPPSAGELDDVQVSLKLVREDLEAVDDLGLPSAGQG